MIKLLLTYSEIVRPLVCQCDIHVRSGVFAVVTRVFQSLFFVTSSVLTGRLICSRVLCCFLEVIVIAEIVFLATEDRCSAANQLYLCFNHQIHFASSTHTCYQDSDVQDQDFEFQDQDT